MRSKLLILLCLLPLQVNANWMGPGDILGRDLDVPGMGDIGHVGIAYADSYSPDSPATQVIEVLNENPVIQINTIENFKSKTKYWGSRWIITGVTKARDAMSIIAQGIIQQALCPIYTSTAQYRPGTSTSCAIFRCDTFVYYIFNAGAGCKLIKDSDVMLPNTIYNAFPNSNGDLNLSKRQNKIVPSIQLSVLTAQKLSDMSLDDFMQIINAPIDKITNEEINDTWKFSQDYSLSSEKRTLLVDKLGFIGRADMLSDFVDKYSKMNDSKVKSMLLRSTLTVYQKYSELENYPKEKEILQNFYQKLLDTKLSANDANIVIRGFTQLSESNIILANLDKINNILNNQKVNLNPYVSVALKIELAFKSKDLEKIYISDILNILKRNDNTQIENLLNQLVIRRLSQSGLESLQTDSKSAIRQYLDSVRYKYIQTNKEKKSIAMSPPFYGAWLEASALVSSSSLEQAGEYVATFLQDKDSFEQMLYVSGLSNNNYMRKAFNTYRVLINFKNNFKNIYDESVGTPWWCTPE